MSESNNKSTPPANSRTVLTGAVRAERLQFAKACLTKGMVWREANQQFVEKFGLGISTQYWTNARKKFGFGDGRSQTVVRKKPKPKVLPRPKPAAYRELVPAPVVEACQPSSRLQECAREIRGIMSQQNIRSVRITRDDIEVTKVEVVTF